MPHVPFVMISEVYAKDMVSKAFAHGVEFYINKPIHVIEVLGVLKRIDEKLKMQQVISSLQMAFASMNALHKEPEKGPQLRAGIYAELREIYSQLGILSEMGAKDLQLVLSFSLPNKKTRVVSIWTLSCLSFIS